MLLSGTLSSPRKRPGNGLLVAIPVLAAAVSPLAADIVHNDDVIIDGSAAIGFDAVNGENFGFDTLRLKENNLRVHFDDTSNSSSFPNNDWRIVINDSSNGGGNFFAVEDATAGRRSFRVDAGAPSDSIRVDSQGDVGLGVANPVVEFHMADGDTPTVRLEQNGTSGFTPQTWDVAGNETNFFIRDTTNGSTLPFRIKPGAATSSIYIGASVGSETRVGMGNTDPKSRLHVHVANAVTDPPEPEQNVFIGPHDTDTDFTATFNVQGNAFISETLEIGSSRTRKEKIRELSLDEALGALEELTPVQFHYKQDPESQLGFIAEDVPEIVATEGRKSVRPMDFVAVLAKVVQEHERREGELTETIGNQQREIERLAERLSALEGASPPDPTDPVAASAEGAPGR